MCAASFVLIFKKVNGRQIGLRSVVTPKVIDRSFNTTPH